MSTSLFKRPLDLVYFIYFATHIPVTLCIDFQVFYPSHWVPQLFKDALAMFINDFKDPFMGAQPYWFISFIYAELVFQFAFFFVACRGLWKDALSIRLGLLVYSSHVATTVWPSLVEVLLNPAHDLTQQERYTLAGFYLPYFVLPLVMLVDSYGRIVSALKTKQKQQ
ncbi:hypothetical protein DM01DRAFT_1409346 [Hesseltinella vesiculosa]|uniref:Efficient mitochondria targeting-associated protein 19 n=1 Tax=Hesseltinella vesiculosa TaxID=101127 RepID=A0A1X2GBH8_9FUNG|nr:hypothetical protein DM01DRAFT_1409346 [Hesseltinella vesiculosa]